MNTDQRTALKEMIEIWEKKMEMELHHEVDPTSLKDNTKVGLQQQNTIKEITIFHERTKNNTIECKTIDEYLTLQDTVSSTSTIGSEIVLREIEKIIYSPPKLKKGNEDEPLKIGRTSFKTFKDKNNRYIAFSNHKELDKLLDNRKEIKDYILVYSDV